MKTTINQRIESILLYLNISLTAFAKQIGVAQTSLRDCIKNNAEPKYSTLNKIIIANPIISPEWLLTGKGEMLKKEQPGTGGSNISGSSNASIENSGNFGSVGGNIVSNHINVSGKEGVDQKIIEPDGKVTIDIKGSKELELMQVKLSAAEGEITMLKDLIKEKDCTIERQNRVIDKLTT